MLSGGGLRWPVCSLMTTGGGSCAAVPSSMPANSPGSAARPRPSASIARSPRGITTALSPLRNGRPPADLRRTSAMTPTPIPSPLRNGYLVRNRVLNSVLRFIDGVLSLHPRPARPIAPPRRILVANIAHLGDVLLSTGVLAALRAAVPHAHLGLLAGSWSRVVLEGHQLVDALHHFDHALLNRGAGSRWEKLRRHLVTRRRAVAEIRAARYDLAIDLYPYFPNAIPLLWAAGVPARIGYTSGGFGRLLTHPVPWSLREWHVTGYHAHLLDQVSIPTPATGFLPPVLPADQMPLPEGLPATYIVLHAGAGANFKEWPVQQWRQLVQQLRSVGYQLVFTGNGERERQTCAAIMEGQSGCVNYCGRLSWRQFVGTVRRARLVIGVDSVAGHVASATGTPCVVLATGIPHPKHWVPCGPDVRVLRHSVACSPCYRSQGCDGMECIRTVRVTDVFTAAKGLLAAARPQRHAA